LTIFWPMKRSRKPENKEETIAVEREKLAKKFGVPERSITLDYVAARIEAEEPQLRLKIQIRNWQKAFGVVSIIAVIATAGFFLSRQQAPVIPYVAMVDRSMRVQAIALPAAASKDILAAVKDGEIRRWLQDARTIISDWPALQVTLKSVMNRSAGSATVFLRGWYGTYRPDKRAENETVTVEITNILPRSADTFELEWTEHVYAHTGEFLRNELWKGLLTVAMNPAGNLEENPTGFHVTQVQWSKRS
jgi:type IV secretion system protein TrbF